MIHGRICGLGLVLASVSLSLAAGITEPDSVRDYIALREMMGKGIFPNGTSFCEQLIDKYPGYISLYDSYAEISQYNGTLRSALRFLDRRCDGSMRSAYSLYGLGCVHMRLKEYDGAQDAFEHSIQFGLHDPRIVKGLAYAYGLAHGIDRAITHYRVQCHRYPDRSDLWYALSLSCWARNDHVNALDAARRAAVLKPDELHYRIAAAVLPFAAGQHEAQEKTIVSLIDSVTRRHEFETLGFLRSILVRAFIQDQRLPEAHFQTKLLLTEMSLVGDLKWIGWSYLSLSDVEFMEADFVTSLENTNKAIESAKRGGDHDLEWEAYNREFDCFMELGLFREAIRNAQMRLSLQTGSMDFKPAKALADNARVFMEVGEYEVALEYGIRAIISLEGTSDDPSVAAIVHSTLGRIYMGLRQYEEAKNQFAIEERIIGGPLFSLRDRAVLRGNQGNCYLAEGSIGKAGVAFREQLGLVRKTRYSRERAYALLNLGNYFYALGDYWKAREEYLLALSEAQQLSLRGVVAQAAHSLATLSERLGSEQETIDWLKRAIGEWQKTNWLARTGLLGTRGASAITGDFEKLLTLLFRLNRKDEAFNFAEIWNSNNGLLLLERKRGNGWSTLTTDGNHGRRMGTNSDHENEAKDDLHDQDMTLCANHAIDELAQLVSWGDALDEERGGCSARDGKLASPKTLQEIRKDDLSGGRTAILSFFFGERNSYLFVVTRDTLEMIELVTTRLQIKSLVKRVGSFIDASPVESAVILGKPYFNRAIADSLYTILIIPVQDILVSVNRLLIVRGYDLEGFPFEMLPLRRTIDDVLSKSHPNFLVENFEVSYRYAAGLRRVVKAASRPAFPFLFAIGSNLAARSEVPPIATSLLSSDSSQRVLHEDYPQINSELRWLRSEFGRSALVLMDTEATKERLLHFAEVCAVIHIASHSQIRGGAKKSGSILLSSGDRNGLSASLRVYDVLRMKTGAQLVVLSSCRTAMQPEFYSGTDYAKSFLIAGAASVLGSLWDVDDACTEKMMRSFYKHLRDGDRKSKALQAAKKELIDDGVTNPYYWASFILIGDDDPIDFPTDDAAKSFFSWTYPGILVAAIALAPLFIRWTLPLRAKSRLLHR